MTWQESGPAGGVVVRCSGLRSSPRRVVLSVVDKQLTWLGSDHKSFLVFLGPGLGRHARPARPRDTMSFALPAVPPCTIAEEGPGLPLREFDRNYRAAARPVVIRNATRFSSAAYRVRTTIPALVDAVGEALVTLSSANAFSYGRRKATVAQYLKEALGPEAQAAWAADDDGAAASLFYWFGEHGQEVRSLVSAYPLPSYASPGALTFASVAASGDSAAAASEPPALSFGVGPDGSGVPFHFHNDGFSEVLHGAKFWLLYPHRPPRFRENATSVSWLRHDYPQLGAHERPHECLIGPGDLLYFPKGWWHAIVNVGETVFMSTFL